MDLTIFFVIFYFSKEIFVCHFAFFIGNACRKCWNIWNRSKRTSTHSAGCNGMQFYFVTDSTKK